MASDALILSNLKKQTISFIIQTKPQFCATAWANQGPSSQILSLHKFRLTSLYRAEWGQNQNFHHVHHIQGGEIFHILKILFKSQFSG